MAATFCINIMPRDGSSRIRASKASRSREMVRVLAGGWVVRMCLRAVFNMRKTLGLLATASSATPVQVSSLKIGIPILDGTQISRIHVPHFMLKTLTVLGKHGTTKVSLFLMPMGTQHQITVKLPGGFSTMKQPTGI